MIKKMVWNPKPSNFFQCEYPKLKHKPKWKKHKDYPLLVSEDGRVESSDPSYEVFMLNSRSVSLLHNEKNKIYIGTLEGIVYDTFNKDRTRGIHSKIYYKNHNPYDYRASNLFILEDLTRKEEALYRRRFKSFVDNTIELMIIKEKNIPPYIDTVDYWTKLLKMPKIFTNWLTNENHVNLNANDNIGLGDNLHKEKGVTLTRWGTWCAKLTVNGEVVYLGSHANLEDANAAVLEYRKLNPKKSRPRSKTTREPKQSKYRGVYKQTNTDKWIAKRTMDGKVIYLGTYETEEAAKEVIELNLIENPNRKEDGNKGLYQQKGSDKWMAKVYKDGKGIYLGTYATKEEGRQAILKFHNNKDEAIPLNDVTPLSGVTLTGRGKWLVRRFEGGKKIYIGTYKTAQEGNEALKKYNELNKIPIKKYSDGTIKRKFVYPIKNGGWIARIPINGKQVHLGTYKTSQEAYEAYLKASKEYEINKPHLIEKAKLPIDKGIREKGVMLMPNGRWRARIYMEGSYKYLGYYETREEANKVILKYRKDNVSNLYKADGITYKGVYAAKNGHWIAKIAANKGQLYLGIYKSKESAHQAIVKYYKRKDI